jgi:hypothetical protein
MLNGVITPATDPPPPTQLMTFNFILPKCCPAQWPKEI